VVVTAVAVVSIAVEVVEVGIVAVVVAVVVLDVVTVVGVFVVVDVEQDANTSDVTIRMVSAIQIALFFI
jgi:hypothetical protein